MDQIACPKCSNTLDNPHILDCGHNLCLGCLQELHTGSEVSCPACGATAEGPLTLTPNTALATALNILKGQQATPPPAQKPLPKPGASSPAPAAAGANPTCAKHPNYVIDIYCHDCADDSFTCSYEVLFETHKGHNCQPIKEVATDSKGRLEGCLGKVAATRAALKAQVEQLVAAKASVENNRKELETRVNKDIDDLIQQLQDHRAYLHGQIRKNAEAELAQLSKQQGAREKAIAAADKDVVPINEAVAAGMSFEAQKGLIRTDLSLRSPLEAKASDNYTIPLDIDRPAVVHYAQKIPTISSMGFKVWSQAEGAAAAPAKAKPAPAKKRQPKPPPKKKEEAAPAAPVIDPADPVGSWLSGLGEGFINYKESFTSEGFESLDELALLTAEDLEDLGVEKKADRDVMLKAIAQIG